MHMRYLHPSTINIFRNLKFNMADSRHLKNQKLLYLCNRLMDFYKIWQFKGITWHKIMAHFT